MMKGKNMCRVCGDTKLNWDVVRQQQSAVSSQQQAVSSRQLVATASN